MDLQARLKRVPKWAWYTSAGVTIAAIILYMVRNRAGVEEDTTTTTTDSGQPVGYPDAFAPSPVPGIVVPNITLPPDNTGENGYLDLHNLYMEALRDFLEMMGPVQTPAAPAPVLPTPVPGVTGGGVPSEPRDGTTVVQPPPSAPQPVHVTCCNYSGHPLSWWRNASNAYKKGKGWKWPGEGGEYKHTRAFEGNRLCDDGTHAPSATKKEC